jgi:hypothetical protein
MLEFLAGGDTAGVDARTAAHVARAICRLALTGSETVAALQAVLLEDAGREVRATLWGTAEYPQAHQFLTLLPLAPQQPKRREAGFMLGFMFNAPPYSAAHDAP